MLMLTRPAGTRGLWSLPGTRMSATRLTSWTTRSLTDVGSRLWMTAGGRETPGVGQEAGGPELGAGPGAPEKGLDPGLAAGREAGPGAAQDPEEEEVQREMRGRGAEASPGPRVARSPGLALPRKRRVAQDPDPSQGVARTGR